MSVETAYNYLYTGVLIWLSILILFMLIRSVLGPRITDRLLAINMIGTLVISCIAVLSRLLHESYLIDAALIYAMISFVSVLILAMIYIPVRQTRGKFGKDAIEEIRKERNQKEIRKERSQEEMGKERSWAEIGKERSQEEIGKERSQEEIRKGHSRDLRMRGNLILDITGEQRGQVEGSAPDDGREES